MLWFGRKPADAAPEAGPDVIVPGRLDVAFDPDICGRKLSSLQKEIANQAEQAGTEPAGLAPFIESLSKKHELFMRVLAEDALDGLDAEAFGTVLDTVFTARRRLPAAMAQVDHPELRAAVQRLLYGDGALKERMESFGDVFASGDAKVRRAAWDLAAELLHFREPDLYPLMARWVWDVNTMSGALRELIRGNDAMRDIPLDGSPETFEGARGRLAEFLSGEGFYRDVPYIIDLLLAKAYSDYVQDMAKGVGVFAAELGARNDPMEFVTKMLGIDPPRRRGRARSRRDTLH